jgi:hypothetical protein
MKQLAAARFSISACRQELDSFQQLLDSKQELIEKEDILPFFRQRPHLSLLFATFNPQAAHYDRLAVEFDIFGDFRADLVAADSLRHAYTLVEFEDASAASIFCRVSRHTSKWGDRFERAFSQVIDWFYSLDDLRTSRKFEDRFGSRESTFVGVVILGRDAFIDASERRRLNWRVQNVAVQSKTIICMTFDELYQFFARKLIAFQETEL